MLWTKKKKEIEKTNPEKYGRSIIDSIQSKAEKYKRQSRIITLTLALSGAATPVFIMISGSDIIKNLHPLLPEFLGKWVPSVLGAVSVAITSWTGLERPVERWKLYRRYHRLLEAEEINFLNKIGQYSNKGTANQNYFSTLNEMQRQLHNEWEGVVKDTTWNGTNKHG